MERKAQNEDQARYWNGDESAHWLDYEARYEVMLAPFTERLVTAAAPSSADAVLDVGCGCGATTRAAGRVVADGEALGMDLSAPLLRRAEQRAREDGLTNVRFEQADVQVHKFARPAFDAVISRFGVMFFDDPMQAFANLGRALRPGGRLIVVCWAAPLDNEWITVPGVAAAQQLTLPPGGDPGGPGPFSFADRHRLERVLVGAGFARIEITPLSIPMLFGSGVVETTEFLLATGFGRRLLEGASHSTVSRVAEAVSAALEPYLTPSGVVLGSKAWLAGASPGG